MIESVLSAALVQVLVLLLWLSPCQVPQLPSHAAGPDLAQFLEGAAEGCPRLLLLLLRLGGLLPLLPVNKG